MNRDELVFGVAGSTTTPAVSITLAQAGLREREHLQEWVLAHPEMLGVDVLVITSEFDRWMSRGGREADRLDVLGLDADGTAPTFLDFLTCPMACLPLRM